MKKYIYLSLIIWITTSSCQPIKTKLIFENSAYKWYEDRIVQSAFCAKAFFADSIVSTYQSAEHNYKSPIVDFKFAINGVDNETFSGADHHIYCDPTSNEISTPLILFGEESILPAKPSKNEYLRKDTRLKIQLDMREVFKSFEHRGYFITKTGAKIYKEDFKAVFVAGSEAPLIWDFDNLSKHKDLELKDPDGDGIYEVELILNPEKVDVGISRKWSVQNDCTPYPSYEGPTSLENSVYKMGLDEMVNTIEPDSTLRTGKEWSGVWTRDVSYSIWLAMAYMQPAVSMNSLLKKVNDKQRIIQDTGTGGAWPCSTDRVVWSIAAWELYKVTGSTDWLRKVYPIIKNTLEDDALSIYDPSTGLMMGESSFIDWREQSYPVWMQPADIFQSKCLGTNVVHYEALTIASKMATLLHHSSDSLRFTTRATELKKAINKHLWLEEKHYYAQYLYGRKNDIASTRSETLGEALSILFDVASPAQQSLLVKHVPIEDFGAPVFYPQIKDIPPYHNHAVWPFVSSYWMLASAKAMNEESVMEAMGSIYRAAMLFCTNKENFVVESGDYLGTQINSSNMLWSLSGNLSIVYRLLFGMRFEPDSLHFSPFVPERIAGKRKLSNFGYRDALFTIEMEGFGNSIASFTVDGVETPPVISADCSGKHKIRIVLSNKEMAKNGIYKCMNKESPNTVHATLHADTLKWENREDAVSYLLLRNGAVVSTQREQKALLVEEGDYQVIAIDASGTHSFASEPISYYKKNALLVYQVEQFNPISLRKAKGYAGRGFTAVSMKNREQHILIPIDLPAAGTYAIQWKYANGNGPINTENKCAIRSLYVDGDYLGIALFPQRGVDQWSNWGWSNVIKKKLPKGRHTLELRYRPINDNMNRRVNEALLDFVQLTRMAD